jgi:murein DD-endopeptidase MepM/ murein hydrolase activator NlpD
MDPSPPTKSSFFALRAPKASFWLQLACCAVVIWSLTHGGVSLAPDVASAAPTALPAPPPVPAAPAAQPAPADSAAAAVQPEGAISSTDVTVRRNDTLDAIFRRLKLDLADLATLRALPGVRAALDRLNPGESLHFTHKDGALYGLERRVSDTQTLHVTRDPVAGLTADLVTSPLDMHQRTVHGQIDSSLFEAVAQAGAHDQTAVALADIFGWDIDFVLDVRAGDTFVVTYSEVYRDGVYLHDGPILAAEFVNQGREYRAVRYTDPDGSSHYYTPDGKSLHKAFLRAPVEFSRVSSRFNSARRHPILNLIRAHKGVDYAAPQGTPVRAAGDGRVRFAGPKGGYGNVIELEHSSSVVTVYGHLSRFAHGIHAGTHVTQGYVIGYVGMTGLATGPHLHYEYRVNGVFKNPQTVALPGANPIEARWRQDFLDKSAPLLLSLEPTPGAMLVAR